MSHGDVPFSLPGPQVLLIDELAAEQFGRFKALLRRVGGPIGDIDLFIAGVAVRYGLTVVTNNTGHFARIPNLPLENWLETPQQSSYRTFWWSCPRLTALREKPF
jgi:hypothetical protein